MIVATQGQIQEFYKGGSGRIFFKGGGGGGVQPLLQNVLKKRGGGGGGGHPGHPSWICPWPQTVSKGVYLLIGHANKIDCFSGPPAWGKNFLYGDHMSSNQFCQF